MSQPLSDSVLSSTPLSLPHIVPDLTGLSVSEREDLALQAVRSYGTNQKSNPKYSLRRAAEDYGLSRSTLTNRFNGVKRRKDAHEMQQNLTNAQEQVLVEWARIMARRSIPLTPTTLAQHASIICGKQVGSSWPGRFMKRHPELKIRMTRGLESCRARALNPTLVKQFFNILVELIEEFKIIAENMYNMDEKGIQLGIGKNIAAIVERELKNVYHVEEGNRELVTIIETVCADGSSLPPSVIFQGKRRNLEWGRNNPCNASISHSPKGWTDQELGTMWLERDFEPATAARNKSGGYCLLILDGHNSHCTYKFLKFAYDHKIIVLCLPSHTTHALQPCDVGVFGPLASCWKAQVNKASQDQIVIGKNNLLEFYHAAHTEAFKDSTIISAFKKTGIWPCNPDEIPITAYDPAINTSTETAQPLPATIPDILIPTPTSYVTGNNIFPYPLIPEPPSEPSISIVSTLSASSTSSDSTTATFSTESTISARSTLSSRTTDTVQASSLSLPTYILKDLPPPLRSNASKDQIKDENRKLRELLHSATIQLQRDYAQMVLMDAENGRLRKRAFAKKTRKRLEASGHARHMTAEENLFALAQGEQKRKWRLLFKEAKPLFKAQQKIVQDYMKAEKEAAQKEVAAARKAVKDNEKETERARKEEESNQKKLEKERERLRKKAEKEAEQARKKEEREERAAERAHGRGRGRGRGRARGRANRTARGSGRAIAGQSGSRERDSEGSGDEGESGSNSNGSNNEETHFQGDIPQPTRPRPVPKRRRQEAVLASTSTDAAPSNVESDGDGKDMDGSGEDDDEESSDESGGENSEPESSDSDDSSDSENDEDTELSDGAHAMTTGPPSSEDEATSSGSETERDEHSQMPAADASLSPQPESATGSSGQYSVTIETPEVERRYQLRRRR